jgi:hypothetical protein
MKTLAREIPRSRAASAIVVKQSFYEMMNLVLVILRRCLSS